VEESVTLYRAEAEKGHTGAQNDLGLAYEGGIGLAKEDAEALLLYRQAADNLYPPAFFNIGRFYWGRG
jgi:uncharacterized protein